VILGGYPGDTRQVSQFFFKKKFKEIIAVVFFPASSSSSSLVFFSLSTLDLNHLFSQKRWMMSIHTHFGLPPDTSCMGTRAAREKKRNRAILQFDTNHIIFRNVEIFKNYFLQIKKYIVKDNSEYLEIFHLLK
jgi:hypothetical protein